MNWLSRRHEDQENNSWQSIADILAAILLLVLLILMLLILYVVRRPEEKADDELGNTYTWHDVDDHGSDEDGDGPGYTYWAGAPVRVEGDDDGDSYGGGGNWGEPRKQEPHVGDESTAKAAVHVRVLDAETKRLIQEPGVTFEVFAENGVKQTLNSYYPEKRAFRSFETEKDGTFYLPEKVRMGEYYLHEVTAPNGYDSAEDVQFALSEGLDWGDAYTVEVLLSPSQNVIRIKLLDAEDRRAVSGGMYEIIADGDIVTMDQTVRYMDGQVVGTITVDAEGYGESKELYLGKYLLREVQAPTYYAGEQALRKASTFHKDSGAGEEPLEFLREKTRVKLRVLDELYDNNGVGGAVFTLYKDGQAVTELVSDAAGFVKITDLDRNAAYRVEQTGLGEGYYTMASGFDFAVSADGTIEGEPLMEYNVTNRMLRLAVNVKDALLPGTTTTRGVVVYNSAGQVADQWDTAGFAHVMEGVVPGDYTITVGGKSIRTVTVEDTVHVQDVTVSIWTMTSVGILIIGVIAVLAVIALAIWLIIRNKNLKKGAVTEIDE